MTTIDQSTITQAPTSANTTGSTQPSHTSASTQATTVGTLYGVGIGPGDPELITIKAFRMMKEADVIAYPSKRSGSKSYAYSIVEHYTRGLQKEMLGLIFPMTRDINVLQKQWGKTVEQVYAKLAEGKNVVFVTEGDPNLYSTFIHMAREMNSKHPDVPIVTVPGISSVLGAAARIGVPLADGDEQVAIIPALDDREAMRQALVSHDTVIFLKVAKVLDLIIDLLDELGLTRAASVVTKVTSGEETIWRNVEELRGEELEYLTLMVVRKGE
ncbi:precorrin-2 C(20)-methyltransferase [Brevibacillus dissolubilis]|uniref:precorrin-2 C(20)-methyltransferase n=1 Tax=Brevibacillus dissolubilis TaxID=1844116 RepID=UPI001116FBAF|nr:precorrin-2 C(20)-methyltransferase [Brevibacillus dissolubilis]